MKVVLGAVLLLVVSCSVATFGQDPVTAAMAACGPKDDKVRINPDTGRDPSAQPECRDYAKGWIGWRMGWSSKSPLSFALVLGRTRLAPSVRQLAIKLRDAIEADSSRTHRRTSR